MESSGDDVNRKARVVSLPEELLPTLSRRWTLAKVGGKRKKKPFDETDGSSKKLGIRAKCPVTAGCAFVTRAFAVRLSWACRATPVHAKNRRRGWLVAFY